MNCENLGRTLERFKNIRIMVIGDVMIDHYLWGKVDRISPEAPVPVVDVVEEEFRIGGAANVALNIKTLEAIPYLVGVAGEDKKTLSRALKKNGIEKSFLVTDKQRPTTIKSRIIANNQQVVRIDRESKIAISKTVENELIDHIESHLSKIDAVILEDYNKGLLTPNLIRSIIKTARQNNTIVCVDPKFKNFYEYEDCTLFKPNILELQKNSGIPIESEQTMDMAAGIVQEKIRCEHLIVTRGEKGLSLYTKDRQRVDIPTFAQEIYDVSGAGDTVISTITLGLCSGLNIETAALIANHAAGSVCSKIGIHPVTAKDILASFDNHKNCS